MTRTAIVLLTLVGCDPWRGVAPGDPGERPQGHCFEVVGSSDLDLGTLPGSLEPGALHVPVVVRNVCDSAASVAEGSWTVLDGNGEGVFALGGQARVPAGEALEIWVEPRAPLPGEHLQEVWLPGAAERLLTVRASVTPGTRLFGGFADDILVSWDCDMVTARASVSYAGTYPLELDVQLNREGVWAFATEPEAPWVLQGGSIEHVEIVATLVGRPSSSPGDFGEVALVNRIGESVYTWQPDPDPADARSSFSVRAQIVGDEPAGWRLWVGLDVKPESLILTDRHSAPVPYIWHAEEREIEILVPGSKIFDSLWLRGELACGGDG